MAAGNLSQLGQELPHFLELFGGGPQQQAIILDVRIDTKSGVRGLLLGLRAAEGIVKGIAVIAVVLLLFLADHQLLHRRRHGIRGQPAQPDHFELTARPVKFVDQRLYLLMVVWRCLSEHRPGVGIHLQSSAGIQLANVFQRCHEGFRFQRDELVSLQSQLCGRAASTFRTGHPA